MYKITANESFDSAHFLKDYDGKCANIHGHRWKVLITAGAEELSRQSQTRGMVTDFGDLKRPAGRNGSVGSQAHHRKRLSA